MDSSNGIDVSTLENINPPIDEILQSIFGNHEEDSRVISPDELFSENTNNDNECNSHYFKRTNNSIQCNNSTIITNNSDQISSPSYLEYASPELMLDNDHQLDPISNSIPMPIAPIPQQLTHQTITNISPSDHRKQTVYVENFPLENDIENAPQQIQANFTNPESVSHSIEDNESAGYTFMIQMQMPTTTNQSQGDSPQFLISPINSQNFTSDSHQSIQSTPNKKDSNNCQEAKTVKLSKRKHLTTKRKRDSSNTTNDISSNKICLSMKYNKQSQSPKRRDKREKSKVKLCPICGDTASSHMHYGGRSCTSCRAFFRRTVVKQSRITGFRYFCKCSEECDKKQKLLCNINEKDRNFCKYCRYKRCRDVAGLVQKWVPSAFKDMEDYKRKKQTCPRKNETNNEQATEKVMNTIPLSNKHEISGIQEMIDDMRLRYKDSFLENKMLIETFQSAMQFCDPDIPESCRKLFEHLSSHEMQHIANQFDEFKQLSFEIQVALLKENAEPFSKICFLKLMFDSVMKEVSHYNNLTSVYLKLFNSKRSRKKRLKSSSTSSIKRFLSQMIEMAKQFKEFLMFFLPIVLFHPLGINDFPSHQNMITEYQRRYTLQLERIILFHQKDDVNLGAVNFRIANDLILRVREI